MQTVDPLNIIHRKISTDIDVFKSIDSTGSIESINKFHAAGHGTFFTGVLHLRSEKLNRRFSWVYDCGSRRKDLIKNNEDELNDFLKFKIDMICLSHFDADHINAVEDLIRRSKFNVRNLVLPYLPLSQRLKTVFKTKSIDVLSFALDPIGYLQAKGLLNKVDQILLIQGSDTPASNPIIDESSLSSMDEDDFFDIFPEGKQPDVDNYPALMGGENGVDRGKQKEISGNDVKNILSRWEFLFFNLPLESIAPKSRMTIEDIHAEIKKILISEEGGDKLKIKILKNFYEENFGPNSKKRNDISLCVLFRPLNPFNLYHSIACVPISHQVDSSQSVCCIDKNKFGILLTGDISLNKSTINLMRNYFRVGRWDDVCVIQIPHHGSSSAWKVGNHKISQHLYSVLCVPDKNEQNWHPHDNVLKDIVCTKVLRADYSNSVIYKVFDFSYFDSFNEILPNSIRKMERSRAAGNISLSKHEQLTINLHAKFSI
jgi:hypothetical protein